MAIWKLKIEGMTCGGCANGVTMALNAVPGVTATKVDLAGGSAKIDAPADIDPALLTGAVEKRGFRAAITA